MTENSAPLDTCKADLVRLKKVSEDIIECTQGDILGFSRLADLQTDQVRLAFCIERTIKELGGLGNTDNEVRGLIESVEKLQERIDNNLKIHVHLMREELNQLRSAKGQLFSLNETYKIKFKRPSENFDTRS